MFQNALEFSNVKVRDCIVPRTEVVGVDKDNTTLEELMKVFVESGISKVIIYDGGIDNVVGYIHSSEMFHNSEDWKNCIKALPIVPETMAAHKLMKQFMDCLLRLDLLEVKIFLLLAVCCLRPKRMLKQYSWG